MLLRPALILSLLACLLCRAAQGQQHTPLQITMQVSKIVKMQDGDGKWNYLRIKNVQDTKPGDTLEYIVTYANVSSKDIHNVAMIGPIPAQTYILPDTIKSRKAGAVYQASCDNGVTYNLPPLKKKVKRGNNIVEAPVAESEWTHLQWAVDKIMPGESAAVRYWVVVR